MQKYGGIPPFAETQNYVRKVLSLYRRLGAEVRHVQSRQQTHSPAVLAVPVIVLLLYFPNRATCILAVLVFGLASLTDMVDGIVARRQNMVTNFGKFLDPLADKVLIGSVLIMLAYLQWVPAWVVVIIVCREHHRHRAARRGHGRGHGPAADRFGKLKTILQTLALIPCSSTTLLSARTPTGLTRASLPRPVHDRIFRCELSVQFLPELVT